MLNLGDGYLGLITLLLPLFLCMFEIFHNLKIWLKKKVYENLNQLMSLSVFKTLPWFPIQLRPLANSLTSSS